MKNNSLFLLVAALFAIVSCGATDLYAQKRVSQYKNGIYYSSQQPVQNQPAQIYSEEVQAIDMPALGIDESYEERLRKFDSPVYIVNVEYADLYPWWTLNFAWNSRSWSWYHSWYSRPIGRVQFGIHIGIPTVTGIGQITGGIILTVTTLTWLITLFTVRYITLSTVRLQDQEGMCITARGTMLRHTGIMAKDL